MKIDVRVGIIPTVYGEMAVLRLLDKSRATLTLSFGTLTWPHFLVRGMLFEQIYRALSIRAGHPYHR